MKFVELDPSKHDLNKVSKLIYETELSVFRPLLGKNKKIAIENITGLILLDNNIFTYENIHVAINSDNTILGILVSCSGDDRNLLGNLKDYSKILNFYDFIKFMVKGTVIGALLTANVAVDEYYLSNIATDHMLRGQGIGTYILENAIQLAKDQDASKAILNVTFKNKGALRLYQRFGFEVSGENNPQLLFKNQGTYNMEYIL